MSLQDKLTSNPEGLRLWHQERAILETTEMICEIMAADGISRSELAKRLEKSRGYITQLLDGTTNMTIRTVSDVFVALGRKFNPANSPLNDPQSRADSTVAIHGCVVSAPTIDISLSRSTVNA